MKLKNKKTGEIAYANYFKSSDGSLILQDVDDPFKVIANYTSLAKLNEEWEDYEEPKNQYYLDCDGTIFEQHTTEYIKNKMKEIGNYFETKEETEKAVEKLKAWKRLKDKGFKFTGFAHKDRGRLDELEIYCQLGECPEDIEDMEDVCLLFGDEK